MGGPALVVIAFVVMLVVVSWAAAKMDRSHGACPGNASRGPSPPSGIVPKVVPVLVVLLPIR